MAPAAPKTCPFCGAPGTLLRERQTLRPDLWTLIVIEGPVYQCSTGCQVEGRTFEWIPGRYYYNGRWW